MGETLKLVRAAEVYMRATHLSNYIDPGDSFFRRDLQHARDFSDSQDVHQFLNRCGALL